MREDNRHELANSKAVNNVAMDNIYGTLNRQTTFYSESNRSTAIIPCIEYFILSFICVFIIS